MLPSDPRQDLARRLRDVQLARARLTGLGLAELLGRLPVEAAQACGLERVLLMLVRDGELVAAGAHDRARDDDVERFLTAARALRPRLAECPPEAEAVARGRPVLVEGDRLFRPLVVLARAETVVLAPLVHVDRTIALLYGDRRGGPELDTLDRDLVWTFATTLAPILHLATLSAIARTGDQRPPEPPPAAALSARELGVLRSLVGGENRAAIAAQLGVPAASVDADARSIARKLAAAGPASAVARRVAR